MTLSIDHEYLKSTLLKLLEVHSPTGYTDPIVREACRLLEDLGLDFELTRRGAIRATLSGRQQSPDRAIVAHLDTTGAMVKELKANGRLAVVPIGTWSPRFAEGARVSVFTDDTIYRGTILPLKASGHTFNDEVNTQPVAWENLEIRVDERAGSAEDLSDLGFNVGDFVGIDSAAEILPSGFINARHLDDKAGVAALLAAVKFIIDQRVELPVDIHLLLTISEEVGSGASAVLHGDVSEMVSIDNGTSAPGQASSEFGVTIAMADSTGPFDYHLTHHLINLCRNNDLPFVRDVFRYYRCDSASAVEAGNDIRTALVTFGVDGSHGYERTNFASLESVAQLLIHYATSEPLYKEQTKKLNTLEGFPETRLVDVESEIQEESAKIAQTPPAS
jgi:peptidase M42 family hydrolase